MEPEVFVGALLGVASHLGIFIRGEWHMQAAQIFFLHVFLSASVFVAEFNFGHTRNWTGASLTTSKICLAYTSALWSSIVVYRFAFHRLRKFPGPRWARATKLWQAYKGIPCRNHLLFNSLHERYGDFVRTGPAEITVYDCAIFQAMDGPGNNCEKSVWYDIMLPNLALFTVRDKKAHDSRRRLWDQGFGSKAMEHYSQRASQYTEQLERIVCGASSNGSSINVRVLFQWFAFDVMGDFALARDFGMLEHKSWHDAVIILKKAMKALASGGPVVWATRFAFDLMPGMWPAKDWFGMVNFCEKRMCERVDSEVSKLDAASRLVDDAKKNGVQTRDMNWLRGDAATLIVAGSDTVASTLVMLFYHLALDPAIQDRLFDRIAGLNTHDAKVLSNVTYLDNLIDETLRLHPAVPTQGTRHTPKEGLMVRNTWIPGNTYIIAPRYTIGRRAEYFAYPEEFIPERWSSRPELVRDVRGYNPFGTGRYNCIGKNIARTELRLVAARLVQKYHVRLAEGETGTKVEGDLLDTFTATPGDLNLKFERR